MTPMAPPQRDETVEVKARLQRNLLDHVHDTIDPWPGWVLSDVVTLAMNDWLSVREAEAAELVLPGQKLIKAPGEPFPAPPGEGIKSGRPAGRGRPKRGPTRPTTLHLPPNTVARFRNAVAWTGRLRFGWAIEDALVAWLEPYSPWPPDEQPTS